MNRKPAALVLPALAIVSVALAQEASDYPARIYFGDAKISFVAPANWTLNENFPYGPIFSKMTQSGVASTISCAISEPLEKNRMTYDVSMDLLKSLAEKQLAESHPGYQRTAGRELQVLGRNAYEVTWAEDAGAGLSVNYQTVYLFIDDRIYSFSLRGDPRSFKWLIPTFQSWLESLRILSRQDQSALRTPSRGARWIHQSAGVVLDISSDWLAGVSDDRMIAATRRLGNARADLICTVDPQTDPKIEHRDRKSLEKANKKKGRRILSRSERTIANRPAYELEYEGTDKDRRIRGKDILIAAPKGMVLFTFEADENVFQQVLPAVEKTIQEVRWI